MKKEEKKHPLLVTRFERLTDQRYQPQLEPHTKQVDKRFVETQELDDSSGVVIRKSEFRTINRHEEMKNYRVSDFCLSNMLAAGIQMNPVKLDPSFFQVLKSIPQE